MMVGKGDVNDPPQMIGNSGIVDVRIIFPQKCCVMLEMDVDALSK